MVLHGATLILNRFSSFRCFITHVRKKHFLVQDNLCKLNFHALMQVSMIALVAATAASTSTTLTTMACKGQFRFLMTSTTTMGSVALASLGRTSGRWLHG